jgi:hypothetical protein
LAACRFAGATTVFADRVGRADAGPLDDIADTAIDGYGHASRGVLVGAGVTGRTGTAQGAADGHRRDHLGSECGHAVDRAARHWGDLRRVLARIGEGVRDRDADARGPGAVGSETQEANLEQGMEESSGRRRADCEDEGWADALGAQGGARRGHGHGRHCGGDAAGSRPGRHDNAG